VPHSRSWLKKWRRVDRTSIFAQPNARWLDAFEEVIWTGLLENVSLEAINGFLGGHGRGFYCLGESDEIIVLKRETKIRLAIDGSGLGMEVVPFRKK
jgi:hypothetical protein